MTRLSQSPMLPAQLASRLVREAEASGHADKLNSEQGDTIAAGVCSGRTRRFSALGEAAGCG